jgi:dynein heavy chain
MHEIKFPTVFPDDGTVYDFVFQVQGKGKFMKWTSTVSSELKLKPGQKLKDALVPTVDTARYVFSDVHSLHSPLFLLATLEPCRFADCRERIHVPCRYMHMLGMFIENKIPVLFCGPTGTGKSVYCYEKIMSLPKDKYAPMFLTFSARTSANVTQNFIMSKLDKRRRGHYGPRMGMEAIAMIDDLNMPQVEQYGAQPPIEILRTLLDHGFWSDLTDTSRLDVHDVQVVAAMGPPGGGRNHISSRLVRHMHVIGVADFDDESRSKIFSTVIQYGMRDSNFPMDVQTLAKPIVEGTLRVFREAVVNLLPTPAKSHYLFNLRDFARVINGVLMLPGTKATDKNKVIRLWAHEVLRVFNDRLTDIDDREWLHGLVTDITKETFKLGHAAVFGRVAYEGAKTVSASDMEKLKFGVYVHPQDNAAPYDECLDDKLFYNTAKEALDEYNQINKTPMELVIFEYVLMHLSRICRVLKQEGGHALLVGVGGSGRQSNARLAAQVLGYDLFQPEITKT